MDEWQESLRAVIGSRLSAVDIDRALQQFETADGIAARMIDSLPDCNYTAPNIGPCYSSPALARWKQLTRQAIDQQRQAGKLFGVMIHGRWLYPSAQFDNRGRQSRMFAALLENRNAFERDPVEFAIWLETSDPETGISPRRALRETPDTRTPAERRFDNFVPTIIDPPQTATRTNPSNTELS